MNTSLIPHPRFSFTSPIVTAREMALAAACLGLKSQLVSQYMQLRVQASQMDNLSGIIVMMGEHLASRNKLLIDQATKIASLEGRNRQLTKALHRQASAGHAVPELCGVLVMAAVGLSIGGRFGHAGMWGYVLGLGLGMGFMILVLARAKPAHTTARRRVHPAHLDEPAHDARIIHAIRRDVPLGEAYTGSDPV